MRLLASPAPRPHFLSDPFTAIAMTLRSWLDQVRRRNDLALLMSLEPHMLQDLGIDPARASEHGGRMSWHPAVLATTLEPDHAPGEPDR